MKDKEKTKKQLGHELEEMQKRGSELEKSESEPKRMEEALRESEEWFRSVFDGSRDAVFITGENTRFAAVNQAAVELTGYSKEELTQMTIPDLHDQVDQKAYKTFFHRIMAGEAVTSEAKIRRKDGTKVDTEFSNQSIKIRGVPYMHTVARDITARKRAEEKIKKSLEEKEILMKEIHHRVKNNMQVISSLLNLQARGIRNKKVLEALKSTQRRIYSKER